MPAVEPVSIDVAKGHLRVTDDDPYVDQLPRYIIAARQHIEQILAASIANQERELILDQFPVGVINLRNGPALSVTEISYIDTTGAQQTVDEWILSGDRLAPAYGASWPATRDQIGAVTITYQAGMMDGSPLACDDEDIVNGILLVLGDLWDNRQGQFVGVSTAVNETLLNLLHFHRRDLGA